MPPTARPRSRRSLLPWCLLSGACASSSQLDLADQSAWTILHPAQAQFEHDRAAAIERPHLDAEQAPGADAPSAPPGDQPEPVAALDLPQALKLAFESNREFLNEKEALFLSALSLVGSRHAFQPLWSASLNAALSSSSADSNTPDLGATASIEQALPWGGSVSASASTGHSAVETSVFGSSTIEDQFDSSLSLQLTQPLLRGAGKSIALEALTQAERTLVYEIRAFELFREDFAINVASSFYGLVQQKQALGNQLRNLEGLEFSRKQAEALYAVGRKSELDVLRARRSELSSRNDLIEAQQSFRAGLDAFRIFLGLPEGQSVDVMDQSPAFVPVRWNVDSAVEVALHNRLDWRSRREQLEDAQRAVAIAKDGMLPALNLTLSYDASTSGDPSFYGQSFDDDNWAAGLSLEIPIDRVNQRNAWRSAQIALDRQMRSTEEFRQNLVLDVRSTFRELDRRRQSLAIQSELIEDQERNVRVARLQFERGDLPNRDVVEAQQALLEARNSLVGEQVAYEIARLGLLRDLGILFIDEKGMFVE